VRDKNRSNKGNDTGTALRVNRRKRTYGISSQQSPVRRSVLP
jgi:hypothetical protein